MFQLLPNIQDLDIQAQHSTTITTTTTTTTNTGTILLVLILLVLLLLRYYHPTTHNLARFVVDDGICDDSNGCETGISGKIDDFQLELGFSLRLWRLQCPVEVHSTLGVKIGSRKWIRLQD